MSQTTIETAPSVTLSVTIAAPYDLAFDYLADGRHITEWAAGEERFLRSLREEAGSLFVTTPFGEQPFRVIAERESGIVDHVIGEERFRARLIPNGNGVDYLFTLQKPPFMSDEAWEDDVPPELREELGDLKRVLESRAST